jgi:uncharacterized repeat protein (TIGR01451 family)
MMRVNKTITQLGSTAVAALLLAVGPQAAWGVTSSTAVNSFATVSYEISSVAQPNEAASANFVVDKKVDVLVENLDGAAVIVAPDQATVVLKFRVTNQGNDIQDILITATALSGAAAKYGDNDNFNALEFKIYKDEGNGSWDGKDTESDITSDPYIDELAISANSVIYLVGDIPVSQADESIASYFLEAQVAVGGTGAAKGIAEVATGDGAGDTAGSVDIVFADGSGDNSDATRDGKHTLQGEWKVGAATLVVGKSSVVVDDYVSASNYKRIPGAVVEYTIKITNNGGTAATNVGVVDDLTGLLTNVTFGVDSYDTGKGIKVTTNAAGSPAVATEYTTADDGDIADYDKDSSGDVVVTDLTVPAGEEVWVQFQVTIN